MLCVHREITQGKNPFPQCDSPFSGACEVDPGGEIGFIWLTIACVGTFETGSERDILTRHGGRKGVGGIVDFYTEGRQTFGSQDSPCGNIAAAGLGIVGQDNRDRQCLPVKGFGFFNSLCAV